MHSKFYLFSKSGTAKYVSMVGSANPYQGNIYNSWNDAHTIVGNTAIYNALVKYFNNLLKDKTNLNYYRTASSGKYKLYFFPRKRGVTILEVLKGVRCTGVKKGYGSGGRTVIRIGQWGWTAPRADIARQLSQLQGRGCKVEVIINKARTSKKVFAPLLRNTKYGKIKIYDGWYDGNDNGVAGLYIHHKVLAINGRWFGSKGTKVVYTGSQNYTEEGNRVNDETDPPDQGQLDVQPLREEPELHPRPRHQGTDHHACRRASAAGPPPGCCNRTRTDAGRGGGRRGPGPVR